MTIFNLDKAKPCWRKHAAKSVTAKDIKAEVCPKRDPTVLVASSKKVKEILGWETKVKDVKALISSV